MTEINSLTPSYGGITFERLDKGGLQWPLSHYRPPRHADIAYFQIHTRQRQFYLSFTGRRQKCPTKNTAGFDYRQGSLPISYRHNDAEGEGPEQITWRIIRGYQLRGC